jgi:hypothetical protein
MAALKESIAQAKDVKLPMEKAKGTKKKAEEKQTKSKKQKQA